MERAMESIGQSEGLTGTALSVRDGMEGRPIARLPDKNWFLRQEQSARARDTEYASTFCHESPRQQLDQMLQMTFNDGRIQRETKINIADYPRSHLRTAMMGWGARMRQIYVPELKTDSNELHQHYAALGIPHEYDGAGARKDDISSPGSGKKLQPQTAPAMGGRRPSIKSLQKNNDGSMRPLAPFEGNAGLGISASSRPDGSSNVAATEYRGQFCKNVSMEGTLERTQIFMDGPIDFDQPNDLEQSKLSIRQRHARESERYNNNRELYYATVHAKLQNSLVQNVYEESTFRTLKDPWGTKGNAPKRHRPILVESVSSPRIPHIATLQKDLAWQPPDMLQSLAGKAGPCQLTSQRNGFYGIQQAHSPRRQTKWGHTRIDRRPHYSLDVTLESKSMGWKAPDRYSDENTPNFAPAKIGSAKTGSAGKISSALLSKPM